MKKLAIGLIKLYHSTKPARSQFTKVLFGSEGSCRFYPTCSDYAAQAINKHGVVKGIVMGFVRVLRCGPWSKGGLDPVR